jgi:hypothetical protein
MMTWIGLQRAVWAWTLVGSSLALSAQTTASASPKDDIPAANPARPTVTNPATLTPVGYLQFEQGYLGSFTSPETDTQHGINQSIKLTVHPRLMLQMASQPYARSTSPVSHDAGDLFVGFQAVLWNPPDTSDGAITKDIHRHAYVRSALPTIAFTYLERVHSGTAPDIDLGSQSRTAYFLFSGHAPLIDVHYDINIVASEQTNDVPIPASPLLTHTVRRAQFGQTFSIDRPISDKHPNLQFALEVYHFSQPLVTNDDRQQPVFRANLFDFLFAPSYLIRPNLVLDCGFSHGFTSTSTRWQAFTGFTYLLPHRLWPDHSKKTSRG